MSFKPMIKAGLLVEELETDVVVADSGTGNVVCLSGNTAQVFLLCDGERNHEEIARQVFDQFDACPDLCLELALNELIEHNLLAENPRLNLSRRSRRDFLRSVAALVPAAIAVLAPMPAAAQSTPCGIGGCVNAASCIGVVGNSGSSAFGPNSCTPCDPTVALNCSDLVCMVTFTRQPLPGPVPPASDACSTDVAVAVTCAAVVLGTSVQCDCDAARSFALVGATYSCCRNCS